MILRNIELKNFGLYAGTQRLDLVSSRGKPVVLIGGQNGAGKTTLLEAVRLALYGKRALGVRVGQSEYEQHLRERMHVGSQGKIAEDASVGLEFDYAEAGRLQRFYVCRSWIIRGSKTVETLALKKDGAPVESVPPEEWQTFLHELIPPGVSQLFFFDGEKIAEIARDDPDEGLADAVRGLLGIELVGRLRKDLGLYLARHARAEGKEVAERFQSVTRSLDQVEREINVAAEEAAELNTQHLAQIGEVNDVRQRFTSEGGDAARRRAELEASQKEIREQIGRRQAGLREMMGRLLPFAMAPNLSKRFSEILTQSGNADAAREANALRDRLLAWRDSGETNRRADWKDEHWQDLETFLTCDVSHQKANGRVITSIDRATRHRFSEWLSEARNLVPTHAELAVSELDTLSDRLGMIEAELERASGKAAGVLLDELLLAEKDVGVIEAQLKAKNEELNALNYQKLTLEREQRRALEAQNELAATEERAELAGRVGRVLQQYEERLRDLKIAQLRDEFVNRFNYLARKGEFVMDVRIDPDTFDATLIDQAGTEIKKSSLSAGEKQIYAIAMLWALARTSGRALPMIIDTPLARLDSEHRSTIVERYFPEASHQVIILSTDTEVDEHLLKRLSPSISHAYRLDYDHDDRATKVTDGYFGDMPKEMDLAI